MQVLKKIRKNFLFKRFLRKKQTNDEEDEDFQDASDMIFYKCKNCQEIIVFFDDPYTYKRCYQCAAVNCIYCDTIHEQMSCEFAEENGETSDNSVKEYERVCFIYDCFCLYFQHLKLVFEVDCA